MTTCANIFALTSLLERHKLKVYHAESGKAGIEILKGTPDIDVVLMDIMMPGMDGYETTHEIRLMEQFRSLPIIAVTAKAMIGDRRNVLEAWGLRLHFQARGSRSAAFDAARVDACDGSIRNVRRRYDDCHSRF